MSIHVNNITKIYGSQKAVDNANFNIESGEIVGLLGPNGAGKSTLMKIITCFIPPSSGEAKVCGIDVIENSLEVRKKIGYLSENNSLYLDMYVHEFLSFIASVHIIKNKNKRIKEIIEITGLSIEQNKKIGQLSKGYRQRVGLAQALIHDPEVLILDEPTSGLDPNQIIEIRNLIKQVGNKKTVLISTHIMQEVEAICSRAIIINHGKIIADDKLDNLKIKLSVSKINVEFDIPVEKDKLMSINGVINCFSENNICWEIETTETIDVRKEIFNFAVENKITVLSLEKEKHSIEELFRKLTK